MASAEITQSIFDLTSAAGAQFFAMLLGAFLASLGGFSVAWVLDRLERKREERSTALVMLDLLTSLNVMTNLARDARGRGDPYGPLTMRLITGCRRDLEVYERNRERIADIADPNVRAEIYQCMTRLTLSLDGILSESELIERLDDTLGEMRLAGDQLKLADLTKQREERNWRRNSSFDFMMETVRDLGEPLAAKLRVIAKAVPQSLHEVVARQTAASSTPAPTAAQSPKPQAAPADV
jgi:hypothetical protein